MPPVRMLRPFRAPLLWPAVWKPRLLVLLLLADIVASSGFPHVKTNTPEGWCF